MDQTILIISIAILLGFFAQTTAGFGATLLAFPFLLTLFDLPETIGVTSIFLVLFSVVMVPKTWGHVEKKMFWPLAITSVIGLTIGIQILKMANPLILKKLLGIFTILYVIYQHFKKEKIKVSSYWGPVFGLLGGFFSGLFNSGGTIFVMYINSKVKSIVEVRGTIIAIMALGNVLRIPLLIQKDILTMDVFTQAIWGLPAFVIALLLGHLFYKKINKEVLRHIIMLVLLVMGVMLIIR